MITLGIESDKDLIDYEFRKKYRNPETLRYANNSYAIDIQDRKLITGYCFFLNEKIDTWYNKQ